MNKRVKQLVKGIVVFSDEICPIRCERFSRAGLGIAQ